MFSPSLLYIYIYVYISIYVAVFCASSSSTLDPQSHSNSKLKLLNSDPEEEDFDGFSVLEEEDDHWLFLVGWYVHALFSKKLPYLRVTDTYVCLKVW